MWILVLLKLHLLPAYYSSVHCNMFNCSIVDHLVVSDVSVS